MAKLKLKLGSGREIFIEEGTVLHTIVKDNGLENVLPVVLCRINGTVHELSSTLKEDGDIEVIDTSTNIGSMVYTRTAQFVLIKAVSELFSDAVVTIEHSIDKAFFGEIHKDEPLNIDEIPQIKIKMQEIIDRDLVIEKCSVTKNEAIRIFSEYKMEDKVRLLKYLNMENVTLYKLDGLYDYFYGPMAYSTGILKRYELNYYNEGFLLRVPEPLNPYRFTSFFDYKKLSQIFYETEKWNNILGVGDVGSLNDKVENGEIEEIIRVAEGLHEKKIAYIADMIRDKEKLKIILISGPSSSGKTTFTKRLGVQLKVNGLIPVPISLDDYFVDREFTPKDKNGDYDFESIYALDLMLFNENLRDLMEGKEVSLPNFDFKEGCRQGYKGKIKLPRNGIIIVEGIHGLNENMTSSIPKEYKFKIYISALTQLNIDNHNRISTTEVRMIRRIVRDYRTRGYGVESTIKMWPSIRKGEETNIFVYQEEANVMFNSTLVHELCVLKPYAINELKKIEKTSPVYVEAQNLINFLQYFKDVDISYVPQNSILREFVGGIELLL